MLLQKKRKEYLGSKEVDDSAGVENWGILRLRLYLHRMGYLVLDGVVCLAVGVWFQWSHEAFEYAKAIYLEYTVHIVGFSSAVVLGYRYFFCVPFQVFQLEKRPMCQ